MKYLGFFLLGFFIALFMPQIKSICQGNFWPWIVFFSGTVCGYLAGLKPKRRHHVIKDLLG